ncbi:ornithine carbamoyltransferase [Thermomonospora echinospora]|uniref:Ornithine carbamoyltransferase n=1 Tax=Thermomonospora echinospora TaxID=1992 RepID=A0A1H5XNU0_9ACTN|nr:ornithine carbamoyltransferase [Thermomonospora echinospora]SEG13362.1 ornithine carbamoyltransferase [Thermomonospora echinospora]
MTTLDRPLRSAPARRPARGLFSLGDVDEATVRHLVERSVALYRRPDLHDVPLAGRFVGILFTRTSTRTRTAFTVGTARLGGTPIAFGPQDLQTNTGESLEDTGRIFGAMLDALVARTAGPVHELRELSRAGCLPVLNAMAAEEHPTQGICDLATLLLHRGDLSGIRVLYVGEGNNTATALAQGLAHIPEVSITFYTPPGYGLPPGLASGGAITETHSAEELPAEVDVVYTTRWQTTGTSKAAASWRETFRPFYVDEAFLDRWPNALFMHDLPAHRGEEVAGAVLDGPRSIAWSQARMKLASAMATLEWAIPPHGAL